MLANDSDPDGDVLTVTSVGTPANGTATLNGNSVTYTPSSGLHRQRQLPVHDQRRPRPQRDGDCHDHGHADPNRPPIANNDAASTAMDTPVTVPVLANDSDPDGDVLTVTSVGTPANGTATLNGNSVTYTPSPGFTGSDKFPVHDQRWPRPQRDGDRHDHRHTRFRIARRSRTTMLPARRWIRQ